MASVSACSSKTLVYQKEYAEGICRRNNIPMDRQLPLRLFVFLVLLGSSRPYLWGIHGCKHQSYCFCFLINSTRGPSIKYVTLFLMIFDPPSPLSQTVTNLGPPLKVCHTSEQKVNKQMSEKWRLPLNNYNHYYILNNNKRPYWVFLINPEIPLQV